MRANGEVITQQQVVERLSRAQQMGLRASPRNIVDDLVTEAIVAQDGYAKGLQRDPAVTAAVEQARRKLAAGRFVAKEIDTAAKATDEQLLAMYHATADNAKIETITLVSEEVAKAALDRLSKGASFAEKSKFAVDPAQASAGGKPVTRSRADLGEELAKAVFAAPLKTWVSPVPRPSDLVVRSIELLQVAEHQPAQQPRRCRPRPLHCLPRLARDFAASGQRNQQRPPHRLRRLHCQALPDRAASLHVERQPDRQLLASLPRPQPQQQQLLTRNPPSTRFAQ